MAAATTTMDVPESQRLIAVSLGKIAASRGQKGGINLHKNLLVATVLHKARTAYMIQHLNATKQRAAAPTPPPSSSPSPSACVEMKEQKPVSESETCTSVSNSTPSPSSTTCAAGPTFHSPSHSAAPQSVTPSPETASVPDGAAGSCMQVAECEDKENTPPPSPCRDATSPSSSSVECEKRLQGETSVDSVKDNSKPALSCRPTSGSRGQHSNGTRPFGSRSSSCCLLKRRRAMDRDHENVSAPKVRIVESRVSLDCATTTTTTTSSSSSSSPEPMQCDSPQISNLVNIFNTSFSGLSGTSANGDVSVRNVGQSILTSVTTHKLSENLTCAKEMKVGLDSVHQPLMLSV